MTSRPATRDCAATGPTAATPRRSRPWPRRSAVSTGWLITLSGSEGPIADLGMLRRAFDAKFWGHATHHPGSPALPGACRLDNAAWGITARLCPAQPASRPSTEPSKRWSSPRRRTRAHPGQRRLTLLGRHALVGRPARGRRPVVLHPGCSATARARRIATADDIADAVVLAVASWWKSGQRLRRVPQPALRSAEAKLVDSHPWRAGGRSSAGNRIRCLRSARPRVPNRDDPLGKRPRRDRSAA